MLGVVRNCNWHVSDKNSQTGYMCGRHGQHIGRHGQTGMAASTCVLGIVRLGWQPVCVC